MRPQHQCDQAILNCFQNVEEIPGTGELRWSKHVFNWKRKSLKQNTDADLKLHLFLQCDCTSIKAIFSSVHLWGGGQRFSIEAVKKNKLRNPGKGFRTFFNIVNWASTLLIHQHQHFRSFWSKLQQNTDVQLTNAQTRPEITLIIHKRFVSFLVKICIHFRCTMKCNE